jgi:HD-GYP domain-containing protein (c-di-GMP phosphodiesterase class II)
MDIKNNYELIRHGIRVGNLAEELSKSLNLEKALCDISFICGNYHDIGKLYIDADILYKKDRLSDKEFNIIKQHVISYSNFFESNNLKHSIILNAIKHHHENYDGTGYPDGLKGENIPLISRIIKICDCYDALTHRRVYRKKVYTKIEAVEIMKHSSEFDPNVLKIFIGLISNSKKIGA